MGEVIVDIVNPVILENCDLTITSKCYVTFLLLLISSGDMVAKNH